MSILFTTFVYYIYIIYYSDTMSLNAKIKHHHGHTQTIIKNIEME